jgi:hypothetical protein
MLTSSRVVHFLIELLCDIRCFISYYLKGGT